MTLRTWVGSVDGDVSDANNWSGTTLPIANDDVIFNSGSVSATIGLSALLEVDLDSFIVTEGYTGTIGTALATSGDSQTAKATSGTTNIEIDATDVSAEFPVGDYVYNTADKTWHRITASTFDNPDTSIDVTPGSATQWDVLTVQAYTGPMAVTTDLFYFRGAGNAVHSFLHGSTSLVTDKVIIFSNNATAQVELTGKMTRVDLLRGDVDLATGANIATLNIGYVTSRGSDVKLTVDSGVEPITVVNQSGGFCDSAIVAISLHSLVSGTWTQKTGAKTIALLNVFGGLYDWQDAGGTITTVTVWNGKLDASKDGSAKTITNSVDLYPGATLDISNGGNNITLSGDVVNYGGNLFVDSGSSLAITYP